MPKIRLSKQAYLVLGILAVFALLAIMGGGGGDGTGGGLFGGGEPEQEREVYTNQDRNGFCWDDSSCIEGLTCKGASENAPGRCSIECETDSDCGNGFLCRTDRCQRDCSELNEKCSDRRLCCFFDTDGDNLNDAECAEDDQGDLRCLTE